jgi:hypothetical protein
MILSNLMKMVYPKQVRTEWKRSLNIFAIIVSFGELARNVRPGLYVTIDLIVL